MQIQNPLQVTPVEIPAVVPLKYCLYARKSSEAEEKQALSIDSQIKEMLTLAERDGINVVDMYRESHSAKACGMRPVFNELVNDIRTGKFNAILVWHPDRLSRNAGDLGALVDLLDENKLLEIRTFSQRFTNNPNEKFLLMILGSQAKLENDNKSINVKRGLRTRVEMGLWPSNPPTGYLIHPDRTMKCHVILDPQRVYVIKMMFEKVAYEKWSGRTLYGWLKEDLKFKTRGNKPFTLGNIFTVLRNHFYCGLLEYPRKSGKWYAGKHEPIISQELFKEVQKVLSSHKSVKSNRKEFAFTRLMKCGLCGSGITAREKYKDLIGGSRQKYIYYTCSRYHDKNCKNRCLREESLVRQLSEIIETIDVDKIGISAQLEQEMKRVSDFRNNILGLNEEEERVQNTIDVKAYAKYILKQGGIEEKRELMQSFTSKLVLISKKVVLE